MLYWGNKKSKKTSGPYIGDHITYHPNQNTSESERGTITNYAGGLLVVNMT